ncbi:MULTISPECIES: type II toxin-antitoxin system VapC family toxin [Corynebacterium]|uniref:type II toxin-antitoxin system VapC family toxin n=1 Tax=Corynebacterium TaxID=1716 RepID=UPI003014E80C
MTSRGLLDTSVLFDLDEIDPNLLPEQWTISSIAFAELAVGPVAAQDPLERARRSNQARAIAELVECIPFDDRAAQAYALVYGAVIRAGRKPRGRAFDLLIASTAVAEGLDLYTRNPQDFRGLEELLNVISV